MTKKTLFSHHKLVQHLFVIKINFYLAATSLRQGSIFLSVCQEFWPRGGVFVLSACWDTPPGQTSPRADTPWPDTPMGRHPNGQTPPGQTPPRADTPSPSRRLLLRTVRILLECILVYKKLSVYCHCDSMKAIHLNLLSPNANGPKSKN